MLKHWCGRELWLRKATLFPGTPLFPKKRDPGDEVLRKGGRYIG